MVLIRMFPYFATGHRYITAVPLVVLCDTVKTAQEEQVVVAIRIDAGRGFMMVICAWVVFIYRQCSQTGMSLQGKSVDRARRASSRSFWSVGRSEPSAQVALECRSC